MNFFVNHSINKIILMRKKFAFVFSLLATCLALVTSKKAAPKPHHRFRQAISQYYQRWTYRKAMTEDGYQVTAYTFKGSEKTGYYPPGRPAVLMVPGILSDGARWFET